MGFTLTVYTFLGTLFCLRSEQSGIHPVPELPMTFYTQRGDVMIGAIIPIHKFSPVAPCSTKLRELGVLQRAEALVFAINEINSNPKILPNISLGFVITDDCSKETTALARALHFVQIPHEVLEPWPAAIVAKGSSLPTNETRSRQSYTNTSAVTSDSALRGTAVPDGNHSSLFQFSGSESPMLDPDDGYPGLEVVGVVGAESSANTVQIARILNAFEVPVVSYISTSSVLSDRDTFPYFARVVPTDINQGHAIASVLYSLKWTYVILLYSADTYGQEGLDAVTYWLEAMNLCVASVEALRESSSDEEYDKVVIRLQGNHPKARVVVLFANLAISRKLFSAVRRQRSEGKFTFVGSDGWGRNLQDYSGFEDVAQGAITINIKTSSSSKFDEYFKHLSIANSTNPWLKDFLEMNFGCSFNASSTSPCSDTLHFGKGEYKSESTSSLVIDAVYSYAYALDSLLSTCSYSSLRQAKHCLSARRLTDAIIRTSFQGQNGNVSFTSVGDGIAVYSIQTLTLMNNTYDVLPVGEWDMRREKLVEWHPERITWKPALLQDNPTGRATAAPLSVCGHECGKGERAVLLQPNCCWYCQPCRCNERVVRRSPTSPPDCEVCPNASFTWPDAKTATQCVPIQASNSGLLSSSGPHLLIGVFVVFILIFVVLGLFAHVDQHHLIKACGKGLCYLSLCGGLFSCVTVLIFVPDVTDWSCWAGYWLFHLSLTVMYAPIAVRTNVIYRLHVAARSGKGVEVRFLTPRCLLAMALLLILLQVGVSTLCMQLDPIHVVTSMPNLNHRYVVTECVFHNHWGFIAPLVFNILLLLACAFHCVRARHVTENFHECRCMCVNIFSAGIAWMTTLITYFQMDVYNHHLRLVDLSLGLLAHCILLLLFVFVPKLVSIYFLDPGTQQNHTCRVNRRGQVCASVQEREAKTDVDRQDEDGNVTERKGEAGREKNDEDGRITESKVEGQDTESKDCEVKEFVTERKEETEVHKPNESGRVRLRESKSKKESEIVRV